MLRRVPLVVILGSTGTGKTKLSIELAQRFSGEIISADSMQVYKGLDIVTAKATSDEQLAAPHHLLDVAQPGKPFTVVDFRDAALPIVDDLLARQKMPIVVGGTNYYIESLLWKVLVNPVSAVGEKRKAEDESIADTRKRLALTKTIEEEETFNSNDEKLSKMESPELYRLLTAVDPPMAIRLHPNNRRKVIRALQVFRDSGCRMSTLLEEQQSTPGRNCLGGPLRYDHVILFWLRCDQEVLNDRLDKRIDGMVAQGMLKEIRQFYDALDDTKDYTKGILQTIGLKEFIPYLEEYDVAQDALITEFNQRKSDDNTTESPEGLPLLQSCLEELRLTTKRYSKKQMKWIVNRFLAQTDRQVHDVFALDSSRPLDWAQDVYGPAESVIESYIEDTVCSAKPLAKHKSVRDGLSENVSNVCDICNRHFVGEFQWAIHLKSNKHKRAVAKRKKDTEAEEVKTVDDL